MAGSGRKQRREVEREVGNELDRRRRDRRHAEGAACEGEPRTHLVVLIDRSGSMGVIADDVVDGFNHWLREQQEVGGDAVVTLVYFDSVDLHDVVLDAVPVAEVLPLDHRSFTPRGATPLLDATHLVIRRARQRERDRAARGLPAEHVVVTTITDGHENASTQRTIADIRRKVAKRERSGWTFAFLSAALDAYGEARSLGYRDGNIQSFAADDQGVALAFSSLSQGTANLRVQRRSGSADDAGEVWGEDKPAESDRSGRR